MPHFLYSVVFSVFFFGGTLVYTLVSKSPQDQTNVIIFIASFFLFFTTLGSLVVYFATCKGLSLDKEKKKCYHAALKKTLSASFFLLGLIILKYLDLVSITILALYVFLYTFGIYLYKYVKKA